MEEIVLTPMPPEDVIRAIEFLSLRRQRIESIGDPFANEGTGLTVPVELKPAMEAVNAEMLDQATSAKSRDEPLVEIHLPTGPALVELIRWGPNDGRSSIP